MEAGKMKLVEATHIYKPGTSVKIGEDIPGSIDYVIVGQHSVIYNISWWSGRDRKEARFYDYEFKVDLSQKQIAIGFK